VKTLEKLSDPKYPSAIRTAASIGRAKVQGNEGIIAALAGNDPALQAAALTSLQNSTDKALLNKVAAKMNMLSPAVQEQLLTLLAARGDSLALPVVMQAAESKDAGVRQAAIRALGSVGNASSVPVLIRMVNGDERKLALESLTRLRGDGVDAAIVTALGILPRPELIKVLVARDAKSAVPALLKLASQNVGAIAAVGKLGSSADGVSVMALLDAATDTTRPVLETALLAIYRRANTVAPVVDAAGKTSGAKKASLVTVLGHLGGAQALPALRAALKETNIAVQTAAARALSEWPDAAPLEDLKAVAATTTNEKVKALALRGVEQMTANQRKGQ
jgi:HEAT repeat protein